MYKEKKFFGLLALLLMGCGSMVAQSKLAPMVSAYVQQTQVAGGSISLDTLQRGVYAVQIGRLGSTLIRL